MSAAVSEKELWKKKLLPTQPASKAQRVEEVTKL